CADQVRAETELDDPDILVRFFRGLQILAFAGLRIDFRNSVIDPRVSAGSFGGELDGDRFVVGRFLRQGRGGGALQDIACFSDGALAKEGAVGADLYGGAAKQVERGVRRVPGLHIGIGVVDLRYLSVGGVEEGE